MIIELLEKIFPTMTDRNSRSEVKNRLKLVLAHDRSDLTPQMIDSMRQEILEVVSKYVELDSEAMDFALENNSRVTALVANLPIRRIKPEFYTVKQSEPGSSVLEGEEIDLSQLPEIILDENAIGDIQLTLNTDDLIKPS